MAYARCIVNPAAGAWKTARRWPYISSLLKRFGLRFEHDITEGPGHAAELARAAVQRGYEHVVSVGGDGTINEVVNGLYDSGNIAETLLGIISTGTGGDYIRTIDLPHPFQEMCRRLVNPARLAVDVGVVDFGNGHGPARRLFVNFAGAGFDAEIARRTTRRYKALGSLPSYLGGLFSTLLSYRNKAVSLTVDGKVTEKRVCAVIINNGRYGGGGMYTAPGADLADGCLDVLVIGDLSKPDLLMSLPRIYKGTHLTHPKVELHKAREVEIDSEEALFLQADGELLGRTPVRFGVMPRALKVAV